MTPTADAYFSEIAASLVRMFGIDEAEAVGRINSRFQRSSGFSTSAQVRSLKQESPDDWATIVYYGGDVLFWPDDGDDKTQPYSMAVTSPKLGTGNLSMSRVSWNFGDDPCAF